MSPALNKSSTLQCIERSNMQRNYVQYLPGTALCSKWISCENEEKQAAYAAGACMRHTLRMRISIYFSHHGLLPIVSGVSL